MKIYKREISKTYLGTAYKNVDESIRLSEIETKPNGSGSDYISIGRFVEKQDEFGDKVTEWHHYAYPREFNYPGFKFKSNWSGKGAQTNISWTFIIPSNFIADNWMIAIIGSKQGGRGHQKSDIDIILDKDRQNIIEQ